MAPLEQLTEAVSSMSTFWKSIAMAAAAADDSMAVVYLPTVELLLMLKGSL